MNSMREFSQHWGIDYDNSTNAQFTNRISTLIISINGNAWIQIRGDLTMILGDQDVVDQQSLAYRFSENDDNIFEAIKAAQSITQAFLNRIEDLSGSPRQSREREHLQQQYNEFSNKLNRIIEYTPHLGLTIGKSSSQTPIIMKQGAKSLDNTLVSTALNMTSKYRTVESYFYNALKALSSNDKNNYQNGMDDLRKSVEEMLRIVFDNQKSLENQKTLFGGYLKKRSVRSELRTWFAQFIFSTFARYQNNHVKHGSSIEYSDHEIELLVYMTGMILRFLYQENEK